MTNSQLFYSIQGSTGEYEDTRNWLAGNNYFSNREDALNYLNQLNALAEALNALEDEYDYEDSEEFASLLRLDLNASADYTGVSYSLEETTLNIH